MSDMINNLLRDTWTQLDSFELRLLLDELIGHPGQYDGLSHNKLYFPLAGSSCRIVVIFHSKKIASIEPGPAFDPLEWQKISEEIENSILAGPKKVGRDYSFSSFRVTGWWQGQNSKVQILPPPEHAPFAPVEIAEHPFVLELPVQESPFWRITNHRRLREHRKLTLLLNILLAGNTIPQYQRSSHFWGAVRHNDENVEIRWIQQFFFAKLGEVISDGLSPVSGERLQEVEPEIYYTKVGLDGKGLRVPSDLDQSICHYMGLSAVNREKFDRAAFWMEMAYRQWNISISLSFTSLISAIEALTNRGTSHQINCPKCGKPTQHETPGATRRFKDFIETYAPEAKHEKSRDAMYSLRSSIHHGSELMQIDQELAFGWDPPFWNERELHDELWRLTRISLRNWLKHPPSS